jgi:hypothetical protein
MAINIISGNLNTWGNNGKFETDPSTWGFSVVNFGTPKRSAAGYEGLYAYSIIPFGDPVDPDDFDSGLTTVCYGRWNVVAGKKYIISCYVKNTIHLSSIGPFGFFFNGATTNAEEEVFADDTGYKRIEIKLVGPATALLAIGLWLKQSPFPFEPDMLLVDKFEIFEYEDVVEACTLEIDTPSCIITDETAPGANDGSITIATDGGVGTLEYSKDNGVTWQLSNLFAGLSPGIYQCKVREFDTISCIASQSFAVNSNAYDFDFTTIVTDESILGSSDGKIEISVTGTVAPFTFSVDGGITFQSSNIFTDLSPGTYTIVTKDSGAITRAKNVTVAPGIALFEKIFFSRNPIVYKKQASVGWDSAINYRLYDDIRVEQVAGSGVFESSITVALTPEVGGNVNFQVREAFRNLKAIPPAHNTNTIQRLTDRIKYFKHFTGEVENTDLIPVVLTPSLLQLVMLGGLDKFSFASIDFFTSYLPTNKKFLTWAPLVKPVDRLQEDYLNFWIYAVSISTIRTNIKAYFDDNTNETGEANSKSGLVYGQLYQLPAGPANSGAFLINPAKNLVKYELWLTDQDDNIISEVRTYEIGDIRLPHTRFFMFLNSLGSYEVLYFNGLAERVINFDRQQITKFLPIDYSAIDGEKELNYVVYNRQFDYSSGYFKGKYAKQWRDYMVDFLLSRSVFEIVSGVRKPIVIVNQEIPDADGDYQYYIRFTVQEGYINDSFTPAL